MGRNRLRNLLEAEQADRLQIGDAPTCPHPGCGRRFCCHYHFYVYRPWWGKTKPYLDLLGRIK